MPFVETRFISPTTLTTSAASALYTVPTGYSAIIKQFVVTNISASAATFTFYIGAASAGNALFSGTSVAANDTVIINLSQVLTTGETLRALASTGSALNLTVSGVINDGPLASTATYIADGAITTAKIADGAIVTVDIANTAVTSAKLADSLALTGTPTAPTATAGTNTTQIATMASKPWNTAWGSVGYISRTTGLTGIAGSATDLTGMSVTFNAVANRLYKATWHVNGYKAGVDLDGTIVYFTNSANTVLSYIVVRSPSGNWALNLSASHVFTTTAGSSTFKLRMASFSGTFSPTADSDNPCQLLIEDIGPA